MRTTSKREVGSSAPYAAQVGGIVEDMAAKNLASAERGVRIPLPAGHWWPILAAKAAAARAKERGLRAPGIRDLARELAATGVTVDTVGRCLRGEIVTWDVAIPLSRILGIPAPARLPATPEEAALIESGDEVRALLSKLNRPG